jgi:hypothetical protein
MCIDICKIIINALFSIYVLYSRKTKLQVTWQDYPCLENLPGNYANSKLNLGSSQSRLNLNSRDLVP